MMWRTDWCPVTSERRLPTPDHPLLHPPPPPPPMTRLKSTSRSNDNRPTSFECSLPDRKCHNFVGKYVQSVSLSVMAYFHQRRRRRIPVRRVVLCRFFHRFGLGFGYRRFPLCLRVLNKALHFHVHLF